MRTKGLTIFDGINYCGFCSFLFKKDLKAVFFIGKTKENESLKINKSYTSYKRYIEEKN